MPIDGILKTQDWSEFNSSLVIEVVRPTGVFTCTGVALSRDLILTAAHCLEGTITSVRVFTQDTYDPKASSIAVTTFKLHPGYDSKASRFGNDLAKIQLKERLPESIRIQPIFYGSKPEGSFFRFGFGKRNKRNSRTVITPNFRGLTGNILELNDTYSYSGDSGGPIFLKNSSGTFLVAIHSTLSFGPEGRYSFNPLIGPHREWIFAH